MTRKFPSFKAQLCLATAITAVFATAYTAPAFAQDEPTAQAEVVVTGTRAARRSKLETASPVDVIRSEQLTSQGSTELAQTLSRVAPSLTFPRPAGTDGTDNIRPASLRGLSPDQTLVLVNGKRRHTSALVNINGSAGRGSSAVDLNAIPTQALDKLEILRDGASAQYGSDAIAGVVNLHLREANKGGNITAGIGAYDTDVKAANSSRKEQDGQTYVANGWIGLPLGEDGFLTLSGEARKRRPTNRGDLDPRVTPKSVTGRYGDPAQESYTLFANAGTQLSNGWKLYGNAGVTDLDSKSAAFFRPANNAGNVPSIYPNGFLPIINAKSKDYSAAIGVKGQWGDWDSDYSLSWGQNKIDYFTLNSVNASYGAASKTSFNDGGLTYGQLVFNGDISRGFDVNGLSGPLTLALGIEARHETYKIEAGELQSYGLGPLTTLTAGAQGFIGFQPSNVVDVDRDNIGAYIDLSADITPRWSADFAARAENYSDFGSNLSGKFATRYKLTDNLAWRGSISSGFRAPSLAQQYFTSTASVVVSNAVVETGTFPATSSVAKVLGATPLEAEKSTNYATGFVFKKGNFDATLDGYRIRISDRIVLSENITGTTQIAALLAPYGISSARFFTNGVTSTTSGVDFVANYRLKTETLGRYDFNLALNNTNTVIDKLPAINTLSSLTPAPALFARIRQYILTNATPENKGSFAVDWTGGKWSVSTKATYYGDVIDPAAAPASDIHTGKKTLVDLTVGYRFTKNDSLVIGADNLFDVYPDQTAASFNASNGALAFTRFSPFGFNGRYVYTRLSHSW